MAHGLPTGVLSLSAGPMSRTGFPSQVRDIVSIWRFYRENLQQRLSLSRMKET
jgi:hypothetical protein